MNRVGVFGGTFDPVHNGHLAVAAEAKRMLKLAEILFMPAGQPYFKNLAEISGAEDRINMLKLAIAGQPCYGLSLIEIEREGPSYAVDSMSKMQTLRPQDELYFILGWDSLLILPLWHDAGRLIELCRIVAAPRPGFPKPDLSQIDQQLPGLVRRCTVMERPLIDISSTVIRQRVSAGQSVAEMVSPEVEAYIRKKGLYLPLNS
ncbi:MAG TPA: nicotinate-nucleotide adenylyltransferase [Dehalococcoidales bacterium]|nr:nicotinate-nucleotide adenylyltransferase [Dehalococcoidales bacterium]